MSFIQTITGTRVTVRCTRCRSTKTFLQGDPAERTWKCEHACPTRTRRPGDDAA